MDTGPVGHLMTGRGAGIRPGIEQSGQLVVIQFRRQRPTQFQRFGFRQDLLNEAEAYPCAGADLPVGQASFQA